MSADLEVAGPPAAIAVPPGAEDRSVSVARANGWAIAFVVPPVVLLAAVFAALYGWGPIAEAGRLPLAWLLTALFGGILLHEVLHAVAWKVAARLPWRDVRLGFQWKTVTPYAHARVPMPARAYRAGAAAPGVVLGLLPALAGLASGAGHWFLFGLLFTLAAGGDALILWLLRGVAPARLVSDHPDRAGCFVWPEVAPVAPALPRGADPMLTTNDAPATAGRDRRSSWEAGQSFADFLPTVRSYAELWASSYARALLPLGVLDRVRAMSGRWHLLAVSADWCIDAPPVVSLLARLADETGAFELRHVDRDAHVELMDQHLTGGRARAIPVIILLDEHLVERAWWGPRPAPLQAWFTGGGREMPSAERYRYSRTWVARDRGQTALEEIVSMMERADSAR